MATSPYRYLWLILLAIAQTNTWPAQLPPSQKLSTEDLKGMTEELNRVKRLLPSAGDKCSVQFQIARTYAAGGQYADSFDWLRKVVDSNCGFDASRDRLFAPLHNSSEFETLRKRFEANTPPVSNSRLIIKIPETDLFPENFAYDPRAKVFYFGSTFKDEIVRCERNTQCAIFAPPHADGLGYMLGLKIDSKAQKLWVTSNTDTGASLRSYGLTAAKLIRSYPLAGSHLFNDLAISAAGDIFVTDTKEGAVYKLARGTTVLQKLAPGRAFTAANGIALSADDKTLFVSNFPDGISVIDLASGSVVPLAHSPDLCLGYIDGLYAAPRSLIAIQNGPMLPRIVRFDLSAEGRQIVGMKVLERRNPLFDGLTTGVLAGHTFYYIANTQIDKVADGKIKPNQHLDPLRILGIDLNLQ